MGNRGHELLIEYDIVYNIRFWSIHNIQSIVYVNTIFMYILGNNRWYSGMLKATHHHFYGWNSNHHSEVGFWHWVSHMFKRMGLSTRVCPWFSHDIPFFFLDKPFTKAIATQFLSSTVGFPNSSWFYTSFYTPIIYLLHIPLHHHFIAGTTHYSYSHFQ